MQHSGDYGADETQQLCNERPVARQFTDCEAKHHDDETSTKQFESALPLGLQLHLLLMIEQRLASLNVELPQRALILEFVPGVLGGNLREDVRSIT